jgi:hypothetical protein
MSYPQIRFKVPIHPEAGNCNEHQKVEATSRYGAPKLRRPELHKRVASSNFYIQSDKNISDATKKRQLNIQTLMIVAEQMSEPLVFTPTSTRKL